MESGGDIGVRNFMKANPDPDFSSFVERGCSEAFQRLVTRYLPVVHSAARRVLGTRGDLSDDVAQMVFIRLAEKGRSLPRTIVLGAWLHRQTVRLALNTLRGESRRQKREQQSLDMQTNESSNQPAWKEVMPHIDQAILELPEMDQSVLTLRFGESRSMKDIGQRLGLSAGAVEKRIARALEKLRNRLSRRGVTSSVAILSGFLASHSAEAAPPLLASTITQKATALISTAGPQFLTSYAAMTAYKLCLFGILGGLIAGGTLVALKLQPTDPEDEKESLSLRSENSHGSRTSSKSQDRSFAVPSPASSVEEIFAQVRNLLSQPDNEISRQRLRGLLENLSSGDFSPLLILVEESDLKPWDFQRLLPEVARAWAAIDPVEAIKSMTASAGKGGRNWSPLKLATEALSVWCRQSPEAAQDWLFQNQEAEAYAKAIPGMIGVVASDLRSRSGDEAVLDWAMKMIGGDLQKAALSAIWSPFTRGEHDVSRAAELPRLVEMLTKIEDSEFSNKALDHLTLEWAGRRPEEYRTWLLKQNPGPLSYEAALTLMKIQTRNFGSQAEIKKADIVLQMAGDQNRSTVVNEIIQVSRQIPRELAGWALPKLEGADRDTAIEKAVKQTEAARFGIQGYPTQRIALDWARHHSNPETRDSLIEKYYRKWLGNSRNHEGAAEFPDNNDWPEEANAVMRRVKEEQR